VLWYLKTLSTQCKCLRWIWKHTQEMGTNISTVIIYSLPHWQKLEKVIKAKQIITIM